MKALLLTIIAQLFTVNAFSNSCSELLNVNRMDHYTFGRVLNIPIKNISYDNLLLYGSYYTANIAFPGEKYAQTVALAFDNPALQQEVHEYTYAYPHSAPDNLIASGKLIVRFSRYMFLVERIRDNRGELKVEEEGFPKVIYLPFTSNP